MTPVEIQRHLVAFNVLRGGLGDFGIRADGVRDDDGSIGPRTKDALATAAAIFGFTGPTWADKTVARLESEIRGWPTPLTVQVGMRALAMALREWCAGVREEPPGSNTGERIRDYFKVCDRKGVAIKTRAGEWCAASASWCTKMALREGEQAPHGFRIGGAELEGDLRRGEYAGRWVPVEAVRAGQYSPRPGDLVILSRAGTWTRHVCRVVALRGATLWTLGGNERNTWMLTPRRLHDTNLRGFGAYPVAAEDDARIAELCPGTAAKMVSEPICT